MTNGGPGVDASGRRVAWLLAATAVLGLYAAAIAVTGGYDLRIAGVRLRSRDWTRPAILFVAGALTIALIGRSQAASILARAWAVADSRGTARGLAIAAVLWTGAAGVVFGTFASGGADSYGYASEARLLAHGQLTDTIPVRDAFKWPDVEATLTPLGFTQGRGRGVISPKYPPGFPLLLAPLTLISESAIYLLVPVLGALAVWVTYRLGVELGDPLAGGLAAVLLSVSPTFLYQVVQPMSDVPVTACWVAALVAASRSSIRAAGLAGALSSLAILIRPNLAPIAALTFAAAVFGTPGRKVRRALAFALALMPGIVVLGWIQQMRYGSPLASGYGTISDGFSIAYVDENLARYPRWITETHTWFIWLSLLAPLWIVRRSPAPLLAWIAVALGVAIWAAYLPYVYFQPQEWFYTRFLLPAISVMLVYASAVALSGLRTLPSYSRAPLAAALVLALVATLAQTAIKRGAFDVRYQERKYPAAGAFVRDHLPATAFVLAVQHSGSIRYYAGLPTLRWDLLRPSQLDGTLAVLRKEGLEPFLVADAGEVELFRQRFESSGQSAVRGLSRLAVLGDAQVYAFGK